MAGSEEQRLPDLEARRRAATDFETNLVVLAGAGTGKTSLLVERLLNAIGSGVATLREVAAITFTEKAAGEMRERLAQGLDRLRGLAREPARLDEAQEADRAFRWLVDEAGVDRSRILERSLAAMEQLDGGTVMTIHRFCSELLRGHPLEAGVDPGFAVDSGEWEESSRRIAWERFVKRELGAEAKRAGLWKRLLDRLPLSRVTEAARGLSGFGIPPALLDPSSAITARELFGEKAERIARDAGSALSRQSGMTPMAERYLQSVQRALEAFVDGGLRAFRSVLDADGELVDRIKNNKVPRPNKALGGISPEEMKRVVKESRELADKLRPCDDELIRLLIEVVAPFAEGFREDYLRQGFVSFDGLLALTRDLLRDHPEVRRALKRRYRLLLVDELQDTDPLQYEIVLFLAERPEEAAADPRSTRLEPGRLFVVGDAKQSIYRFRGADYGAYRRTIERIVEAGGIRLDLVGNFRSLPGIIGPVNRLFDDPAGCWEASDHQPDYVGIEPVRAGADGAPAVEIWTVDLPGDTKAVDRRAEEGRVIAEAIGRWVETERSCEYRQITILFRAFTQIAHYLRPLRERGIPFVVDGGRELLSRPEVGQLMAALGTLGQPADEAALLAFLRSPAGGVSDRELAAYAAGAGRWSWRASVDAERFGTIARAFDLVRQLYRETLDLPVDALIRRVIERTSMLPLGAAAFEGAQRVANLQKLGAAAAELARDGKLSLEEVVEALEQGRLEDIETDRPLADDAAEAVRITSIHRMKGLENDRIVIPDLARMELPHRAALDVARRATLPDGRPGLAVKIGRVSNSVSAWYDTEDEKHTLAEEVRVLYVALTRARERLVAVTGPSRNRARWIDALSPWGYEVASRPEDGQTLHDGAVLHRLVSASAKRRLEEARIPDTTEAVRNYEEAVQAMRTAARPAVAAPSGLFEERAEALDPARPGRRASRDLGKAVGIVLHRLLETWDGEDPGALREGLASVCRETATETGTDPRSVERESAEILDAFCRSDLAGEFRAVERLGRELPLLVRAETGQAYRGSIDLLYRDREGRIVVADYKTDRDADDAELRERYRAQLEVYGEAVQKTFGLPDPPRSELWLLRSGRRLIVHP